MPPAKAIAFLLCAVTAASSAEASDCKSFAQAASDAWKEFRNQAFIEGCASATSSKLARYRACGLGRLATSVPARMAGWYNAYVGKNGALQLGPRALGSEAQRGELVLGASRRYLTVVPTQSANAHVALTKVAGTPKGLDVTVCAIAEDGTAVKLIDEKLDAEKAAWAWDFPKIDDVMLMVRLDSGSPLAKFQYQISAHITPEKNQLGPVPGFADLHLHQMAELAHGGNWYGGHHTGPIETALTSCTARDHAWEAFVPKGNQIRHGKPLVDWPKWDDMGHHQVYRDWLKSAHARGLNLIVAAPSNTQLLCQALKLKHRSPLGCSDAEAVERQIRAIHQFAADNRDWYEVALTPWHARQIIATGKLAVVIGPESSDQFPKSGGDWKHQIDHWYRLGVRTLMFAHLTDTPFAGVAKQGAAALHIQNVLKNPTHAFSSDREGHNKVGLTKVGEQFVDFLVEHHMLIDGAHASFRTWDDVYARLSQKHAFYPAYDSHSRFESLLNAASKAAAGEFITSAKKAAYIRKLGGVVGLRTRPDAAAEVAGGGVKDSCPGSTTSFAQHYLQAKALGVKVAFGADFDGFTEQLRPRFGKEGCQKIPPQRSRSGQVFSSEYVEYQTKGIAHIGYLPEVLTDLRELGVDTSALDNSAEAYIQMWERAWDSTRKEVR
jgi:microsomal dipeptidase-like Zn-dependent dipeptidase